MTVITLESAVVSKDVEMAVIKDRRSQNSSNRCFHATADLKRGLCATCGSRLSSGSFFLLPYGGAQPHHPVAKQTDKQTNKKRWKRCVIKKYKFYFLFSTFSKGLFFFNKQNITASYQPGQMRKKIHKQIHKKNRTGRYRYKGSEK